jgi:cell division transport system permease protein
MSAPWGYFINEALRQAWRQRLLTLVAVASLALAALYGGAWALLWRNAELWARNVGQAEQLAVYLRPGLGAAEQAAVASAARSISDVASVDLVTPEQAKAELSQDPKVKSALDLLGAENPLPATLKIRLTATLPAEVVAATAGLKAIDGVDEVDSGGGAVEGLLKASGALRSVLLGMMAVFSLVALLIVAASLRLAAWSRREELGIMRLVGAGHGFIRAPFLIEGLLQGLLGGLIAAASLAALQAWLESTLQADLQLDLAAFLPAGVDFALVAGLCIVSAVLGALGAAIALATVKVAYEEEEGDER